MPFTRSPAFCTAICDRIDAAHLPGPDADDMRVVRQHDRVALHVLADQPGEVQGVALGLGRLALRDHLPLVRLVGPDVAGLHEQAAVDAAVVEPLRQPPAERAGLQQPDVLLPLLEGVEGVRLVVRGDDALDEPLGLRVHEGGSRCRHRPAG